MLQNTFAEKTAYAALGMPTHLIKRIRQRVDSTVETIEDLRDRLPEQAADAFDRWAEEGQQLVESLQQRVREPVKDARQRVETAAATARDTGRSAAVSVKDPIVPVEEIDGIGPGYANRLFAAGVVSTRSLLDRTRSDESLERLAEQTGIGAARLEQWAAAADLTRIDGIGDEHLALLHRLGVGTLAKLAESDPVDLRRRAEGLSAESVAVDAVPTAATFRTWIPALTRRSRTRYSGCCRKKAIWQPVSRISHARYSQISSRMTIAKLE